MDTLQSGKDLRWTHFITYVREKFESNDYPGDIGMIEMFFLMGDECGLIYKEEDKDKFYAVLDALWHIRDRGLPDD